MSFITFRNFLLVLYQAPAGYQGWQGPDLAGHGQGRGGQRSSADKSSAEVKTNTNPPHSSGLELQTIHRFSQSRRRGEGTY